ncbi:hypothetical protein ACTNEN_06215 [Oribacterium sp. HCP28S3_H8]|uniref:hypothetical protein n=1 Tax=Oribacterium sp. HCP28S3_H8 TaxID=3438945 RepID=UPI003F8BDAD1
MKNGPQTDDTIRQQEALTREIADTEQQLKSLTKKYQNFGSVAGQEIQTAGKKMQDVGDKISGAGTNMPRLSPVRLASLRKIRMRLCKCFPGLLSSPVS